MNHNMDGLDLHYLGSGVLCPGCNEGYLFATRDGLGEVDGYYCDTCFTGVYLTDEMLDGLTPEEIERDYGINEGAACGVSGLTWWEFDTNRRDTPRPPEDNELEARNFLFTPEGIADAQKFLDTIQYGGKDEFTN